jgi:hypothetical protein
MHSTVHGIGEHNDILQVANLAQRKAGLIMLKRDAVSAEITYVVDLQEIGFVAVFQGLRKVTTTLSSSADTESTPFSGSLSGTTSL